MKYSVVVTLAVLVFSPLGLLANADTDRKIEDAAVSSYNFRSVLRNRVNVKAEDGIVVLSGEVLNRDEEALAEDTVRKLPGVVAVKSELELASPVHERADGWIALRIRGTFLLRKDVSGSQTKVTVHDGVVTLRGTADSLAQKERAGSYARAVEGVRAVNNELEVKSSARTSEIGVASPREIIDDGEITTLIQRALLTDEKTRQVNARVETHDGEVVIRGTASSVADKTVATHLARSVPGVVSVTNEMIVTAAE